MNLVFVTRKVDRGDPLTGFVFTWISKLAGELDKLYVICQEKGDTSGLPDNVEVHSFGKEKGYGKLRQGYQLLVMSYKLARRADGFFVHMHPVYAIMVWLPARLLGKKLVLWYTHKSVDSKLRIAHALVDSVLTASKQSFRLPSKKVKIVGHGIDLGKFKPHNSSQPPLTLRGGAPSLKVREGGGELLRIVSVGRISPVKDYETLIKAVEILVNHKNTRDIDVQIYGRIGLLEHQSYLDSLVDFVNNADLDDYIDFQSEVSYEYIDEVYQEADLFVNLSGTGSIDKAVLEAAACGTLVISSNEAFLAPLREISPLLVFQRNNPEDLAEKILKIKAISPEEKLMLGQKLRQFVEREHNLDNLVQKIKHEFEQ